MTPICQGRVSLHCSLKLHAPDLVHSAKHTKRWKMCILHYRNIVSVLGYAPHLFVRRNDAQPFFFYFMYCFFFVGEREIFCFVLCFLLLFEALDSHQPGPKRKKSTGLDPSLRFSLKVLQSVPVILRRDKMLERSKENRLNRFSKIAHVNVQIEKGRSLPHFRQRLNFLLQLKVLVNRRRETRRKFKNGNSCAIRRVFVMCFMDAKFTLKMTQVVKSDYNAAFCVCQCRIKYSRDPLAPLAM